MRRIIFIQFMVLAVLQLTGQQSWRSSLYPSNWTPGYTDSNGRYIHDFSYAGYKMGMDPIPAKTSNIVNVTQSPYSADNTGQTDVTVKIQKALDDVGKAGGGIVYLPKGTYKINVPSTATSGLRIMYSNVILRGAGPDSTFIVNTTTDFRGKQVLYITGSGASPWDTPVGSAYAIAADVPSDATTVKLSDVSSFAIGDLIILATDCTPAMIASFNLTGYWTSEVNGQRYCRIIKNIDRINNIITVDIPIQYKINKNYNARAYKVKAHVTESAIEDLSIGNIENPNIVGVSNDDLAFMYPDSAEYAIHGTHLITYRNTLNCWMRNVKSFRPSGNIYDVHMLSNAFKLIESKNVTVENCYFAKPQYRGGGGNGYMFIIESNDCLITNCTGERARHHFSFKSMCTSGNVVHKCKGIESRLSVDYHMYMSAVNLIDSYTSDGDYIEAIFRDGGDISGILHGYTTTESVIWNTKGVKAHWRNFLIDSRQYGNGYVIGTSGIMNTVITTPVSNTDPAATLYNTSPEDWVEGVGVGATLEPQSLYEDQLARRKILASNAPQIITSIDKTFNYKNCIDFILQGLSSCHKFCIFDVSGKKIIESQLTSLNQLTDSFKQLRAGSYIIQLSKNDIPVGSYKFISNN